MGHSKIFLRPTPLARKQLGQMAKLFGLWDNSKLRDASIMKANPQITMREGAPDFLSQTKGLGAKFVTRRQVVLNRHFTEIVSDVLAINYGKKLNELDIRISSIETKAWNKGVRIFYSRDGPYDEVIHRELVSLEPAIRYEISQRRLIARAPKVNFVFDATLEFNRTLDESLERLEIKNNESKSLTVKNVNATELKITKNVGSLEEKLISKKFIAPPDMTNTILGLNYPEMYDEVTTNFIRGRGESSRMAANQNYLANPKPLFREIRPETEVEDDPVKRLLSMKRFMVNQKLKTQKMACERRKKEILEATKNKWVEPDNIDDDCEPLAPDIGDEPVEQ